jgi:hypothetical protein
LKFLDRDKKHLSTVPFVASLKGEPVKVATFKGAEQTLDPLEALPTLTREIEVGSNHAAVWVELDG